MSGIIDAVESWLAGQSFWLQVPILLAILLPLCWLAAGLIDRVVERVLRPHARRDAMRTHRAALAAGQVPVGDPAAQAVGKVQPTVESR